MFREKEIVELESRRLVVYVQKKNLFRVMLRG